MLVYIVCKVRSSCKGQLVPFCMFFLTLENQFYELSNSTILVYILRSLLSRSQHWCHWLSWCSLSISPFVEWLKISISLVNIGYLQCLFKFKAVGMFYDWPDCIYWGGLRANRNISEKLGMKLANGTATIRHSMHMRNKIYTFKKDHLMLRYNRRDFS